jgi:hypothetical protein
MAKAKDVALTNYRRARQTVNDRLARAEKAGRLQEELRLIEREARAWWAKEDAGRSRRKVK